MFWCGIFVGCSVGLLVMYIVMYHNQNKDLCKTCDHCSLIRGWRKYGDNHCIWAGPDGEIKAYGDKITVCKFYKKNNNKRMG